MAAWASSLTLYPVKEMSSSRFWDLNSSFLCSLVLLIWANNNRKMSWNLHVFAVPKKNLFYSGKPGFSIWVILCVICYDRPMSASCAYRYFVAGGIRYIVLSVVICHLLIYLLTLLKSCTHEQRWNTWYYWIRSVWLFSYFFPIL